MGSGIAQSLLHKGVHVHIKEETPASLNNTRARLIALFDKAAMKVSVYVCVTFRLALM